MNKNNLRRPRREFRRGTRRNGRPSRRNRSRIHTQSNVTVCKGAAVKTVVAMIPGLLRIPRNRFITDAVLVDLSYPDVTYNRNSVGFSYLSWRYRANSVYDPDPTLGSGSVPGYNFYATAFNAYRVLTISYSIDFSNLEGSPVDVFSTPSQTDLGNNYSNANELFGQPYTPQATLSAKGGMDRARLKGFIDLAEFSGTAPQYISNDNFGSVVGTNPVTIIYLNFGGVSSALFTSNNGLDYRVLLTFTVLWTGRKVQTS